MPDIINDNSSFVPNARLTIAVKIIYKIHLHEFLFSIIVKKKFYFLPATSTAVEASATFHHVNSGLLSIDENS